MADTRLGKIGITVKEPYNPENPASYEVLDYVLYPVSVGGDGCGYIALKDNIGVTPGTDDTVWAKASQAGQSIYDLAVKYHHFVGTEEEFEAEYQAVLQAARDAATATNATNQNVQAAEALRVTAEEGRVSAESGRVDAESARVSAESGRVSAESGRVSAESGRVSAESGRVSAESGRVSAESGRVSAEATRQSQEATRQSQTAAAIQDANTARDAADAAAAAATAAAGRAPYIGDNGNWWVWDATEGEYVDSEIDATAPVLTIDNDGTIRKDGEVFTTAIKDADAIAAADHTQAESDHTRAGQDHDAIASMVVDNLTTNDGTKALSAKQGKVLDEKVSQLGQIRELNNTIPINFNIDNVANGLLSSITGAVTAEGDTRYIYTPDYYPVTAGNEIIVCCYGTGSAAGCCFYDENKIFLSGKNGSASINSKVKYTVPENACYVRLCSEQNTRQFFIFCLSPNVDNVPLENSDNLITSGGVYAAVNILNGLIELNTQYINLQNLYDVNNVGYYNLLWTPGKYIKGNGEVGNDSNYEAVLDYIPVKSGDIIWCDLATIGQDDYVVVYDSNKQVVDLYYGNGFEITIEQDGYIRFCNRMASKDNPRVILKNSSLFSIIKELQKQIDGVAKYVYRRIDISNLEVGLLNANGIPFMTTDNRYRYCPDYFRVFAGETIVTNAFATGSAYGIVFYDDNKKKQSIEHSAPTAGVVVPEGAVYVRFCKEPYSASTGLWAKKVEDEYIDPLVDELDNRVTALENNNKTLRTKPFFNIGLDTWIADEEVKNFFPNTQKLNSKYNGEVSPEKRYIAIGFDDFRATDFSMIIPLFDKYGAKAVFNRVHSGVDVSESDIIRINSLINGNHELGDHTWLHYKYPFDEPLMNGQDPSSPEGNQVPFPSNDQLRNDVGDGKNVFGRTLTNNVKTDIGYQAPDIDTTWAEMTDAQCQQFRDYFSVMKDTSTNLIDVLDALSNLYLGTTGSSRGSWDGTNNEYTGGIFTGCKTSCNHEIWERILLVTNRFLKDKFDLNYNLITWSLPGSKGSGCYFSYNGNQYFDANHTKRVGNLARFESSLYNNNDGSAKNRSWTDVLREYGYKTTHDATPTTRNTCMAYQFIMNGQQSRPDALPHPTNRLLSYSKIASEYTKGTDLQGTASYEVQMYDGGANSNKNSFRNEVEQWRHSTANGIIWGAVIDSNDTWSERMILEGLLKYGIKTGIEFVTHAEAYDICFNHPIKNGNLIYNPRFRNTAKEFMPTATTVPSNPDGYRGECSVSIVNGTPVLTTTGETDYRHYGIPYGKIKYSADVKGSGSIQIRAIKNSTTSSTIKTASVLLDTINISNNDYATATSELTIPDNGIGVYEDVYGGYGDKIIGLIFIYSSGLEIKNIDLRTI